NSQDSRSSPAPRGDRAALTRPPFPSPPAPYQEDIARDHAAQAARRSMQADAIAAMWRWSVPQQPPHTTRCGSLSTSARYWAASSAGLPSSSSVASSSAAWLLAEALARRPQRRVVQGSPLDSTSAKWVGWAQLIM